MTTATRPRIATPVKREVEVTCKPKTIKVGHGYYDLKLIKEIVDTLPEGDVTLTSYPGKPNTTRCSYDSVPIKLECMYPRGCFTLTATNLKYYAADKGKVRPVRTLVYCQGDDQPAKVFSLLSVTLPMEVL